MRASAAPERQEDEKTQEGQERGDGGGSPAAAGQRHPAAVAEDDHARPGLGRSAVFQAVALRGPQRGGHARAPAEVVVEALEEGRAVIVPQRPRSE